MQQHDSSPLPLHPLGRLLRRFIATESAGGMVMIVFAALAVALANSPLHTHYQAFVNLPVGFVAGEGIPVTHTLGYWTSELLMAFFFLLVGMELKREWAEGFLRDRSQVVLPLVAAVGGMAVPALLFAFINWGDAAVLHGWAIPSATDIAFALAVLGLCGRGVPASLKVFLLAVAIFDDLGAILIIAFFYSHGLNLAALGGAAAVTAALFGLNRASVRGPHWYLLLGAPLWYFTYHSGIHATLAGVVLGLSVPLRCGRDSHEARPLNEFIHRLHPWVSFVILPLFAFTSAGVDVRGLGPSHLLAPVPLGIVLGLFLGKQLGIFGTVWLMVKVRLASLPEGARWTQLYGVSVMAGIGFTMSLFIGFLAYDDAGLHDAVKLGVLAGSLLSALWGFAVLRLQARTQIAQ